MRSETKWYAFDDTEFDDVYECVAYENTIDQQFESVKFFDGDFNVLERLAEIESDAIFFVIIDSSKCASLFQYLYDGTGMDVPEESEYTDGDIWMYSFTEYKWVNVTEQFHSLKLVYDRLSVVFKNQDQERADD